MNKRHVPRDIPLTPVMKSVAPKKATMKGGSLKGGSIKLSGAKYGPFAGATISPDASKLQGQGFGDTVKKYAKMVKNYVVKKVTDDKLISKGIKSLAIPADAAFGPYAGIVVNTVGSYVHDKFGVGMTVAKKGKVPK